MAEASGRDPSPRTRGTTWDFCAWQQVPPSSPAPPPPCPDGSRTGRPRSTQRRTSRLRPAAAATPSGRLPAAPAQDDQNAELQNLANLHTQGVLTDEEFAAAKAKVLGHLDPASSGASRDRVEAYTRLAGVYDEIVVDPCHAVGPSFLHELWADEPTVSATSLDVCCGTGPAGRGAARAAATGSSASTPPTAMLARARRLLGPGRRPGRATLPDLPVEGVFDAGGLHLRRTELPRPGRPARDVGRAARRLRPGGWLVFDLHTDAMMAFTVLTARWSRARRTDSASRSPARSTRAPGPATHGSRSPGATVARFTEHHRQYFHRPDEVRGALAGAGFEVTG